MRFFLLIIIFALPLFLSAKETVRMADIELHIENIKEEGGTLWVHIFKDREAFPAESHKAYRLDSGYVNDGKSRIIVKQIPFGTYALTIHHDKNNNEKMDKDFFGLPAEQYGLSNNPKIFMSLPGFDECRFEVDTQLVKLNIMMKRP